VCRDPIEERGGFNLYEFANNNSICLRDILGRATYTLDVSNNTGSATIRVTPTLSVAGDPCNGGPLKVNVHFNMNEPGQGMGFLKTAVFSFGGQPNTPSNEGDDPNNNGLSWDNYYELPLAICPVGAQSGSLTFTGGDPTYGNSTALTIIFGWTYECSCSCAATKPFKPSTTLFASPPLYGPRHDINPGQIVIRGPNPPAI